MEEVKEEAVGRRGRRRGRRQSYYMRLRACALQWDGRVQRCSDGPLGESRVEMPEKHPHPRQQHHHPQEAPSIPGRRRHRTSRLPPSLLVHPTRHPHRLRPVVLSRLRWQPQ